MAGMTIERIRRMDHATADQWVESERIDQAARCTLADRMLNLVKMLDGMDDGFAVDQLSHALQTATRAERAGADEQVVVAALMHDVGKLVGDENHDAVSAETVRRVLKKRRDPVAGEELVHPSRG